VVKKIIPTGTLCKHCEKKAIRVFENGYFVCAAHFYLLKKYGKVTRTKYDANEIILINQKYAEICLYNMKNIEVARAIVDVENIEKIKEHKWFLVHGYVRTCDGFSLHEFVMDFYKKENSVIDHINRNRLDNRRENLRIVDFTINGYNKGKQSNNTSSFPGVSFDKRRNKWEAYIKIKRKHIHLGRYSKFEDAVSARKEAEIKYFGEEINRENDIYTVFKKKE